MLILTKIRTEKKKILMKIKTEKKKLLTRIKTERKKILTRIKTERKKILTKIKTERKKIKMEKKKTQMEMKKMQMEKKKMERKMIQVVKEIKRKVGKIPMTSKQEVEVPRLFQLKNQLLHLLHLPLRLLNLKSPRILLKKKIGETTFKFNKRCMKNNVKIQSKIL